MSDSSQEGLPLNSHQPPGSFQPLNGYRVLDLSRALAGPYCTALLGDLGADVIKVEEPGAGDEARGWGPPFFGEDSAYFLSMNRGKRSVAINLKKSEGLDLCQRLADHSDVLIENFRPGVAARLGLGYPALREHNPALVYCSISAYGQDGPMAGEPGYDLIMQGVGGLMSVTGEPGGRPLKAGVAETDILAGTNAAVAILGALLQRERPAGRSHGATDTNRTESGKTGNGTYLDVGLFDGQVSLMGYHIMGHLLSGRVPGPAGNTFPYIVPYQGFRTADGEITVAVNNDRLWQTFCTAIGRHDLAEDARFTTNGDRVRQRDTLVPILEVVFVTRSADEWLARLRQHGIPCGAINTIDRVATHPQVAARGLIVEVEHAKGRIPSPTAPWRASLPEERAVQAAPAPPPLLGEHTKAVLMELAGCTEEVVSRLEREGVVACARP